MKKLLHKASEEREDFHDLIYKDVTFANDIISIGGQLLYEKGEKAFISDVEYTAGHWSRACPDIYIEPKISSFKINGIPSTCWRPETFVEFQTTTNDTTKGND
jgi:hypothetical protein